MDNKNKVSFLDSHIDTNEVFSFCNQLALDEICESDADKVSIQERLTRYDNYPKYLYLDGTTSVIWERKFVKLKYLNVYEPSGILDLLYSLTVLKSQRVSNFINFHGLFCLQEHPFNNKLMHLYTTEFSYVKIAGGEKVVSTRGDVKKFTLAKSSMVLHAKTNEYIPSSTHK